ncbi:MAG TPA: hypothetical protein VKI64_11675, partial [Acidimicrobiales bacterium]|nr:hypothetical protein [Acidimicrobiales bacterium]
FADPDLAGAKADVSTLGLPRAISGNFASVFPVTCPDGRRFVVRCFVRSPGDLEKRYAAIGEALAQVEAGWKASFEFQPAGMRVGAEHFPIVKMAWLSAQPLCGYVQEHLWDSSRMVQLALRFAALVELLRRTGIAHGDLQHGNILVDASGNLRLIDYDGMYVPALAGRPSGERGHRNYQHPGRTAHDYGPHLDNFASWVIYTSLLALSLDPLLWGRLDGGDECLLLRWHDFADPERSPAFACLEDRPDDTLADLSRALRSLVSLPLEDVPPLPELGELLPTATAAGGSSTSGGRARQAEAAARAVRPAEAAVPAETTSPAAAILIGAELARARAEVDELRRQRAEAEADRGLTPALRRAQEELRDREEGHLTALRDELAEALSDLIEEERELYRAEQDERAEALRVLRRESMRAELERHPISRFYGPGVTSRVQTSLTWAGVRTAADIGEVSVELPSGRGKPSYTVIRLSDGREARLDSITPEVARALTEWRRWLESRAAAIAPEPSQVEEQRILSSYRQRRRHLAEAIEAIRARSLQREEAIKSEFAQSQDELAEGLLVEQRRLATRLHELDVALADSRRALAELEWRQRRTRH